MIRVRRPARIPRVLSTKGADKSTSDCAAFVASGAGPAEFNKAIYGHKTVKTALRKAQYRKCCFCESKVCHVSYGDIEHFRPKAGYRQRLGTTLIRPGYFWLAYEWTNLLFACEVCNRRQKGNSFPLVDESTRASAPHVPLSGEAPLFIDPAAEDPEQHIGFREEYPYAKNGSSRGEATWRALGLEREPLAEARRDHLKKLTALRAVVASSGLSTTLRKEIRRQLREAVLDRAPWAAMMRSAFA